MNQTSTQVRELGGERRRWREENGERSESKKNYSEIGENKNGEMENDFGSF